MARELGANKPLYTKALCPHIFLSALDFLQESETEGIFLRRLIVSRAG